jgi:hypothetical protein
MTVFEIPENTSHGGSHPAEHQTRLSSGRLPKDSAGGGSGLYGCIVETGVKAVNHGECE